MEGLVFVVTASSTGIGLGIVLEAAKRGALVVVSSRNQQNVDSALEMVRKYSPRSIGIVCHVGKKEDRVRMLEMAVKEFGRIDVLVLNAAISTAFGNVLEAT
jgi:dehydrogenase/reductase SDR family protein 4